MYLNGMYSIRKRIKIPIFSRAARDLNFKARPRGDREKIFTTIPRLKYRDLGLVSSLEKYNKIFLFSFFFINEEFYLVFSL